MAEEMLSSKYSGEEIKMIDDFESFIKESKLSNENLMLIYNGINGMKNSLFFASLGVFVTFLEKYLRDILIMVEYKIKKEGGEFDSEDFLKEYDIIEEYIEDGKDKGKYYSFQNICDKLYEHKIISQESCIKELKAMYSILRNPVHHGIYRRLVGVNSGSQGIPVQAIEIKDGMDGNDIIALLENAIKKPEPNKNINKNNTLLRQLQLPEIYKHHCFELIQIIRDVIRDYGSKYGV